MAHSHIIKFSNELICSKNIVGAVVRTHGILNLSRTEKVFLGLTCDFYRSRNSVVGRFLKEIIIDLDCKGQRGSGEKDILFRGKAFP